MRGRPFSGHARSPLIRELCAVRLRQERTQRDVAESLGVSIRAFSSHERGEATPNIEQVEKWAQVLGLTLCLLVDRPR